MNRVGIHNRTFFSKCVYKLARWGVITGKKSKESEERIKDRFKCIMATWLGGSMFQTEVWVRVWSRAD